MFRRRSLRKAQREYELQRAPEFLFERRRYDFERADRRPGQREVEGRMPRAVLVAANQPAYRLTRLDELRLSQTDVAALTLTADPALCVVVAGSSRPDWFLR